MLFYCIKMEGTVFCSVRMRVTKASPIKLCAKQRVCYDICGMWISTCMCDCMHGQNVLVVYILLSDTKQVQYVQCPSTVKEHQVSIDMPSVAVGNTDDVALTQIYIVTSNISSYPDASEYCQQEYGGSLIDNDDVNLLYSDANSHLLAGKIDNDVNLFWTNEHLTFSGEYAIAFFFFGILR